MSWVSSLQRSCADLSENLSPKMGFICYGRNNFKFNQNVLSLASQLLCVCVKLVNQCPRKTCRAAR